VEDEGRETFREVDEEVTEEGEAAVGSGEEAVSATAALCSTEAERVVEGDPELVLVESMGECGSTESVFDELRGEEILVTATVLGGFDLDFFGASDVEGTSSEPESTSDPDGEEVEAGFVDFFLRFGVSTFADGS